MNPLIIADSHITPYPLALVVCDGCWCDPNTGKFTLIGTFSTIRGEHFPLVHPVLSAYVALTDGVGLTEVGLTLVDAEEAIIPLCSDKKKLILRDHREVVELTFDLLNLRFDQPGEYRLQLWLNDEFVMERPIVVQGQPAPIFVETVT